MSDKGQLDLSVLAPAADPSRWQSFLDATMARVEPGLGARSRPLMLIAAWAKPITIAAGLLILVLLPLRLAMQTGMTAVERAEGLAEASAESLESEGRPSGAELSRLLLVRSERR